MASVLFLRVQRRVHSPFTCHWAAMLLSHNRECFSQGVLSFCTDTKTDLGRPFHSMFCHSWSHLLFSPFPVCSRCTYLSRHSVLVFMGFKGLFLCVFWSPFPFSSPEVYRREQRYLLGTGCTALPCSKLPGGVRPTLKYIPLLRVQGDSVLAHVCHTPVPHCFFGF